MLSTNFESPADEEGGDLRDVLVRQPTAEVGSLQDDVERLLEIAAQLFSAIERQIQRIAEDLVCACGEKVRAYAQSAFKERLVLCAESLDTSIHAIDLHLERRAGEHITNFGLRDDPST